MKIKDGFVICNVGGKTVAVASGELSKQFNGMITLNSTGEILFKMLQEGTTVEKMADALVQNYGADTDRAAKDVESFLAGIKNANLLID